MKDQTYTGHNINRMKIIESIGTIGIEPLASPFFTVEKLVVSITSSGEV